MTKNWSLLLPLFVAGCIILMLFKALHHNPFNRKSALLNQNVPAFQAETLLGTQPFTEEIFSNHTTVLHFWASWCGYCQKEYTTLATLAANSNVEWVGIAFRDKLEPAKHLLQKGPSPYTQIGWDPTGKIAMDFGVTGAPESFIIDAQQKIRFHYQGPITIQSWQNEFLPVIQEIDLEQNKPK